MLFLPYTLQLLQMRRGKKWRNNTYYSRKKVVCPKIWWSISQPGQPNIISGGGALAIPVTGISNACMHACSLEFAPTTTTLACAAGYCLHLLQQPTQLLNDQQIN